MTFEQWWARNFGSKAWPGESPPKRYTREAWQAATEEAIKKVQSRHWVTPNDLISMIRQQNMPTLSRDEWIDVAESPSHDPYEENAEPEGPAHQKG